MASVVNAANGEIILFWALKGLHVVVSWIHLAEDGVLLRILC